VGGVAALLQPLSGDFSAKHVAKLQPVKLAAMEGHFQTARRAGLHLGGIPDEQAKVTRYALSIPGGLSFLAHGDFEAEVLGLEAFPEDEWPNVAATHLAFQVMVGAGMALVAVTLWAGLRLLRRRSLDSSRWFLWAIVAAGPLGLVAMEAGWFVTELGRQPWIVRGLMRTSEAVTPFPHLAAPFWMFGVVYVFLGAVVTFLLWKQVVKSVESPPAGQHG
jgi:cytochrome d ubiquinol oxidase subunit I